MFYNQHRELLYIGQATNLNRRMYGHKLKLGQVEQIYLYYVDYKMLDRAEAFPYQISKTENEQGDI
ncbi:GIY-YIG nuclease family protein [Alicyclobacillus fastidiosus]